MIRTTLFALAFTLLAASSGPGADWPRFRGSDHSGASLGNGLLDGNEFGLDHAWRRPLGKGYSGISVSGRTGVTFASDGTSDVVVCFELRTGGEKWSWRIAETYRGHSGSEDGPLGSPTIHQGVVYGLGPRGHLFALDLDDGTAIWTRTLDEKVPPAPHYGYSTCPLVAGGVLVVQTGAPEGHAVSAFDLETGEPRWSAGNDTVSYQSPSLLTLARNEMVVAMGDKLLLGLDPATGRVLFSHEHGTDPTEAFGNPMSLPGDRVLVNSLEDVAVFEVASGKDGLTVRTVWHNKAFKKAYSHPVHHEGLLYGLNNQFLFCLDAGTGETRWRSRPPGARGLILVDGKLVLLTTGGELVIADASKEGYVERARVPILDGDSRTPPTFSGRLLLVRSLDQIAAARITSTPMITRKTGKEPERSLLGEMAAFVETVEKAPAGSREGLVDAFLKDKGERPLIEAPDLVHFVHRGEASDVAVSGNFLDWDEEIPLHRIEGTDLHVCSHRLDPEGCYEYALRVDFGEPVPDPGNPETIFTLFGVFSLLQMPGFDAPDLQAVPEKERGRLVLMTLDSKALEAEKKIQVYLPRGYDDESERRYPLLVVTHGDLAVENGKMDRILDRAILEGRVAEVVVAFVPGDFEEYGGSKTEAHARMLSEELLPHLDEHHRLVQEPAARGILGVLDGASMAVYTTFKFPGTFGKIATQSAFLNKLVLGEITTLVQESRIASLDCVIERRRTDLDLEGGSMSAKADSDLLVRILTEKGLQVSSPEVAGSWGMASWRSRFGEILAGFFPPAGAR